MAVNIDVVEFEEWRRGARNTTAEMAHAYRALLSMNEIKFILAAGETLEDKMERIEELVGEWSLS